MKQSLIFIAVVIAVITGWGSIRTTSLTTPLFGTPEVVIYGRDSCTLTRQALATLEESGVDYQYFDVDDSAVAAKLSARLERGGFTAEAYRLPIMEVAGELSFSSPSNGGGAACVMNR